MTQSKRILLVEDHVETQEMFKFALEMAGFEVSTAGNGIKLIKKIREYLPDLIVMDVMMPWIDGYDLCRAVKETQDLKDIPIVIVSAKVAPEDIQTGLAAGAEDYLEKPVEIDELIRTIQKNLD